MVQSTNKLGDGLMKKIFLFLLVLFFTAAVFAQEIKIGTVAPSGSLWETTIKEIAAEWTKISNGEINVKIYSGGFLGDEENIIRQIKLGKLQAAALSSQGIKNISEDLFILSMPMLVGNDDEFDYVFKKIQPTFNKDLQQKGFVSLGWTNTGWVKWFSKTKVLYPDDLKQIRLAVDSSDQKAVQIWQKIGFKVIPLAFTDLLAGISSNNMAEAAYLTPYTANAIGIAKHTPYMYDMPIAPVYAILTISDKAWKSINDKYKPLIKERTAAIIEQFYPKLVKIENEGLEIMKKNGLVVVPSTKESITEWEKVVNSGVDLYIKQALSPSVYSEIKQYKNEYNNKR